MATSYGKYFVSSQNTEAQQGLFSDIMQKNKGSKQ